MAELYEAFVYLWYDALKNMFYLGKHKGSPADRYTHSSTVWESFTKDNIPEGVTRKILAYGTDEEMCLLEHELLKNRKKRCWDKYYNQSLGDPRYVDNSGENHHFYGKKLNEEHKQKIGEARKGTTHTEESKKKISEAKKGKNNPNSRENRIKRAAENQANSTTLVEFLA